MIAGCPQDEDGFIHSPYGAFNPVTGEGYPINAPEEFWRQVLIDLIDEGNECGPAQPFDWEEFMAEQFPNA